MKKIIMIVLSAGLFSACTDAGYEITKKSNSSQVSAGNPTSTGTGTSTTTRTTTGTDTGTVTTTNTTTTTATPSPTPTGATTALSTETFDIVNSKTKKIDFLFVVDNSQSMTDNQQKIADGFEDFANTFYRRGDLDICTAIITTDRYLGKTSVSKTGVVYQRERNLACTKPANWATLSATNQKIYIDNLIADFKTKIMVGVGGSGKELVAKSLVSYLYNLESWSKPIIPAEHTSFFRSDAVANISFVTDENNWFNSGPSQLEDINDLPPVQNTAIPGSTAAAVDARKGVKNHLDEFFTLTQPNKGLSYSVSSFLETSSTTLLAMNLNPLNLLVGRESAKTDIQGDAASFTALYNSVATNLVLRANAFNVAHSIYEPILPQVSDLTVTLVKINGSRQKLTYGSQYTYLAPNGVNVNQDVLNSTVVGDKIEILYRYVK